MSLSAYSLSSGSCGNAVLIRSGESGVLLDAGLSGRELMLRMQAVGFDPAWLRAILISHEHIDHVAGAGPLSRKLKIPVVANKATLREAWKHIGSTAVIPLVTGTMHDFGGLLVRSFPISHDAIEPVGFVFEKGPHKICCATDLGEPGPEVLSAMAGAQLVIIESNHDVKMLLDGPYPEHLKRRVRGPRGHLSNVDAARLMGRHVREQGPTCFWLAHLSGMNNTPELALGTAREVLTEEGVIEKARFEVAHRRRISARWYAGAIAWQRTLF